MKYLKSAFVLTFLFFISCDKKEKDYIIFSGTIDYPITDSIKLKGINQKVDHIINLNRDNSFWDTLSFPKGYYYLYNGQKNIIWLFIQGSGHLKSIISYDKNVASITFEGNSAKENNYLQQKELLNKSFKKVKSSDYYLNLNEKRFLKLSDSITILKKNFLENKTNLDKDFHVYESFSIEFDRALFLNRYAMWRGSFLKNDNFKVSDNFPNPFENIDINNEKLLIHPHFIRYLNEYISSKMITRNITEDFDIVQMEIINNELKNQIIKDKVAYKSMLFRLPRTKKLDDLYIKYMSFANNKTYKKEIEKIYQNFKKISKGTFSPTFKLYDNHNKLVTLESLRGKLVYIDIWATWCVPCIQQIPALNKLEGEFRDKNIVFVSICINDTKERWNKILIEKEMGGIELFAPDNTIPSIKDYFINSIPRFILIDKNGKIIDANAYSPSDSKLKEQLKEYLK